MWSSWSINKINGVNNNNDNVNLSQTVLTQQNKNEFKAANAACFYLIEGGARLK